MAKRPIDKSTYDSMVDYFMDHEGNVNGCHAATGFDRRTVKRGWELGFGWTADENCKRPIREVVAERKIAMRARLAELEMEQSRRTMEEEVKRQSEQKQKALIDATDSKVQEAQQIRIARAGYTNVLAQLVKVSGAVGKTTDKVKDYIERFATKSDDLTAGEVKWLIDMYSKLAANLKAATDGAEQVMQMERLLLGEPNQIVAVKAYGEDVSLEEVERRLEAARVIMERQRARVIDAERPLLNAG